MIWANTVACPCPCEWVPAKIVSEPLGSNFNSMRSLKMLPNSM